jgi:hypothetical protein|tara:strand:- start:445 stop:1149 length:705 start_codon:yes stop_codon:yes gene_type:complete
MAYGLQVLNADGRVQIDSTEIAPNTFISNVTTTAYSAMTYPPSNFATGDLVLARAANSPLSGPTYIGISQPINNQELFMGSKFAQDAGYTYLYKNTAGIVTALLKTQAGNIAGPSSGEMGMDVYSTNGSTILFSATRSTSVKILAQGTLTHGQTFTYTPPSSLTFTKVYAVVNSTMFASVPQAFVLPSWAINLGYTFYAAASAPYIVVTNQTFVGGSEVSSTGMVPYMIVYDTN